MSNEEAVLNEPDLETPELEIGEVSDAPAQDEAPKAHPAHEKLLAELPEAWHSKVIPHLQDQDKAFQSQLEKYTPYKDLVDNEVDPEYIFHSMQLAKAIAEDPVTIHENLTNALMSQGLLQEEAEEVAEEMMDEASFFDGDDEISPKLKKQLEERDEKLSELEEYVMQQEMDRQVDLEYAQIEEEFDQIRQAYEISDKQESAITELMEASLARGEDISVVDAAKKLVAITGVGFKRKGGVESINNDAPVVVGSGGGVPFEAVTIPKDEKAKRAMLAEMFERELKARQNSI